MRFFNRVTLQTPESVELEFVLAGIGNRALALLIDYLLLGGILSLLLIVWGIFSTQFLNLLEGTFGNISAFGNWLIALALLISFAIYVGYFIFFEVFWQGQTPGKRYTKIRVIREDGKPTGLAQATLRALLRPVDDSFFVGFLLIIFGEREKRLGDWVAGTVVIQQDQPVVSTKFVISDQAQTLVKELPQIANLAALTPDDRAVIHEYLQRRDAMESKSRSQLSLQLAQQVKDIVALETVPPGVSAEQFLEAMYLAYQQQASDY